MIFSPWGHPLRTLNPEVSAVGVLKKSFDLHPFAADWNFLTRDIKIEDKSYFDEKKGMLGIIGKEYSPASDDPFIFSSTQQYHQTLNNIKDLSIYVDKSLINNGISLEGTESDQIKHFTTLSAADREVTAFMRSEAELLRKFTIQRFVKPYWYIDNFNANDQPVQSMHIKVFNAMITYCKKKMGGMTSLKRLFDATEMSDPLTTNAGAPYFLSGIEGKLKMLHAFKGTFSNAWNKEESRELEDYSPLRIPSTLRDRIMELSTNLNLSPSLIIGVGANRRFGPSRKWSNIYHHMGTDLVANKETQNLPRIRNVYMASYIYNLGIAPTVAVMKYIRKHTKGWWHDESSMAEKLSELASIKQKFSDNAITIESDFSAYDRTVSAKHRLYVTEKIGEAFPHLIPPLSTALLTQHTHLSYIIPDFTEMSRARGGIECIPSKPIGLYSGLKLTSEIGSYVAMWSTLTTMVVAGIINLNDIENGSWNEKVYFENLGDDAKLTFRKKDDVLHFTAVADQVYKTFGLKATVMIGDRFLMRHYMGDGHYPSPARILQQTISNEHIRKDPNIFAMGFLARTMQYKGLNQRIKSLANKASPNLMKLTNTYMNGVNNVLEGTKQGKSIIDILNMDDSEKLKQIANLSNKIAGDTDTLGLSETLLNYIQGERFSSTGRELMAMIKGTALERLLNNKDNKEMEFFKSALEHLKFKYN